MSYNFANYDKKLISTFEVIGAYFVDIVYNTIYNSASVHRGDKSITDEYKKHIQAFIMAVKNDRNAYSNRIIQLHNYFTGTTGFVTMSFNTFVDTIVAQFVPENYYDLYTQEEKDEILSSVICNLVTGLGVYATTPELLSWIIDKHGLNHNVTTRRLQDHAIIILLTKRDEIHNKLLGESSQVKEVVSISVVENLHKAIKRLVKDKAHLTAKVHKLQRKLEDYEDIEDDYKHDQKKLLKKIAELSKNHKTEKKFKRRDRTQSYQSHRDDNIEFDSLFTEETIDKDKHRAAREELRKRMEAERGSGDDEDDEDGYDDE